MTKLIELCNIQYGYAFDSKCFTEDNSYPQLVRIRDVKRGFSETFYNGDFPEEYLLSSGDLLIGMDGEFNIARWKVAGALLNQRVCKVVAKDNTDEEYLRFALSKALKKIEERTAFVTVKHLSAKELYKLEISVPSYNEQKEISTCLKKLEGVIAYRQQELEKMDQLIKARFVEMFGDPINNTKNLPVRHLGDLGIWNSGGTPSRSNPEYFCGSINWYSAGELNSLYLHGSNEKITEEAVKSSAAKLFKSGSMLVGMYDTAAFKMGILTEDSASNQACACIEPNSSIDIVWLYYALTLMKDTYLSQRRGVRQKNLNLGMIRDFTLPTAYIDEQKQFVSFVEQVDKSKSAVQKALEETQLLFDSLMQKYFG